MGMNPRLMRPTRSGPKPATPSITVTTEGVDATQAVSTITAAGEGDDTTDNFGNHVVISFSVPSAYAAGGWSTLGGNPAVFTMDAAGVSDTPTKVSGDGDVFGSPGTDAVAEVTELDFGGATAGTIRINGGDPIAWDADQAAVEAAIEAVAYACDVSGANGSFTVTADSGGDLADLAITENLLTK